MLALGPRLEACDAALDAKLDALVVARLEMQAVVVRGGSPVPTEQRILTPEKNRCGDRCLLVHSHLHHQRVAERTRSFGEECPRQIRLVAMTEEGVAMKRVDGIECPLVELAAYPCLEVDAHFSDAPALA